MKMDTLSKTVKQETDFDCDDDETLPSPEEFQHLNYRHKISHPKMESRECQRVGDEVAKDVIRKNLVLKQRPPKIDKKSSIQRNHVKHPSNPQSKGRSASPHSATMVDFSKLEERSLRRYCRYYKLVGQGLKVVPKEDLVNVVQRHFMSQRLDELQVIGEFVQAFKRLKNAS